MKYNQKRLVGKIGLASSISMLLSMSALATEDPLKLYHNMSPHDDLLYNASYYNLSNNTFLARTNHYLMENTEKASSISRDMRAALPITHNNTETGSVVLSARLFSTNYDSKVVLMPNSDKASFSVEVSDKNLNVLMTDTLPSLENRFTSSLATVNYNAVKADFTGSGTEEVIAIGDSVKFNTSPEHYGFNLALIQAKDTNDPSQGLNVSTIYEPLSMTILGNDLAVQYGHPVVGDLTGDGNQEIVYASRTQFNVFTVCSGQYSSVKNSVCNNSDGSSKPAYTVIYNSDPSKVNLLPYSAADRTNSAYELHIGNYHGTGNELAVVSNVQNTATKKWIASIDAYKVSAGSSGPVFTPTTQADITGNIAGGYDVRGGYCFATSAKKNLFDSNEQLWLACQNYLKKGDKNAVGPVLSMLQMGFNLGDKGVSLLSSQKPNNTGYWRLRGLSAVYPSTLPMDRNLEGTDFINALAMVFSDATKLTSQGIKLRVMTLNQDTTGVNSTKIFPYVSHRDFANNYSSGSFHRDLVFRPYMMADDRNTPMNVRRAKNMLFKGDLQGQSVKLGAPLYYKTPAIQKPFLIVGSPPAHIGFMLPANNTSDDPQIGDSRVVNLSLDKDNYVTKFEQTTTDSSGYVTQNVNTLTNSVAMQLTAEGSVGSGEITPSPVKASFKATVGGSYTNENTVDVSNKNTSTYSTDLALTSGYQDRLGILSQSNEHFIYPVMGSRVCPDGDDCAESEKGQQYVMYTRQSDVSRAYVDGSQVSWYQPVHEVNNVLSYPRSFEQLETDYGSAIEPLSQADNTFYTATGDSEFKMAWLNGTSSSKKTTLINKETWNAGFSGSYGTSNSFTKLTGVGYNNSFDIKYNGAYTSTGVTNDTSNYAAGSSVTVALPNTFRSTTDYSYAITPVVFSDKLDSSSIDTSDPFMPEAVKETIQQNETGSLSGGYMKIGYYTNFQNIPSNYMGSWWRSRKGLSKIDIGLNNPTRWDTTGSNTSIRLDDEGTNCLADDVCAVPYQPTVAGQENFSPFYNMRGLFVTTRAGGETRFEAEAGEQLTLQARIYNYSLTDMPEGSRVHVQFYRQSVANSGYLVPNSAELTGETWLSDIPGAGYGSTGLDNWKMATVDWDTSEIEGSYYFWVVAWAEDVDGDMISELPGKGLASEETAPLYRDISEVQLEYTTLDSPDLSEVKMTFTNNVGMYPQEFTVLPAGSTAQAATSNVSGNNFMTSAMVQAAIPGSSVPVNPISVSINSYTETSVNVGLSTQYDTQSQWIYIVDADENIVGMKRVGRIFKHKNTNVSFAVEECGEKTLTVRIGSPNNDDALVSQVFSNNIRCH
ncbi:hypothetical protein [uncultured Shewanella sp.]|uniref:hypothetical protein n=1 Tax=uncultured Shewanella sp. TaxID=173975 RepID=UPI00260B5E83|nr:hypothetical protein [uncultured Shewanella sp.]